MVSGMRNANTPSSFSQFDAATCVINAHIFKLIPPVILSPENKFLSIHNCFTLSRYPVGKFFQSIQGGLPTIISNFPRDAVVIKLVTMRAHIPFQLFFSRKTW